MAPVENISREMGLTEFLRLRAVLFSSNGYWFFPTLGLTCDKEMYCVTKLLAVTKKISLARGKVFVRKLVGTRKNFIKLYRISFYFSILGELISYLVKLRQYGGNIVDGRKNDGFSN